MFPRNQRFQMTAVKALIGLNLLSFVFLSMLGPRQGAAANELLGLSGAGLAQGMVWQFLTYQFVHAGFLHLAVNMLGLWFAGNVLERIMGVRKFVLLYLTCGVAGGLVQVFLDPGPSVVGASGAVCGLIAAFSTMFPRMEITALLFFVIPVRMRAMWLGIGVVALSLFFLATGILGNVGNGAHLGGALAGFVWVVYNRRFGTLR
jgi:membrane associated rhomboid family serine protease